MATEVPEWLRKARSHWANTGNERPPFADEPDPGQESVWDYPRPPALVVDQRRVVIGSPENPVAETTSSLRLCETASPPAFYLPPDSIDFSQLVETQDGSSFCEWKGPARYWALASDPGVQVGWDYPSPFEEYAALAAHLSFYPGRIACTVDDERVRPQAGGFYGGWITDDVAGPFKGDPGTGGW